MPFTAYTPVPTEPGVYLFIGRSSHRVDRSPEPSPTSLDLWFVYGSGRFWSPHMDEHRKLVGVFHKLDPALLESLSAEAVALCAQAQAQHIQEAPLYNKQWELERTEPPEYRARVQTLLEEKR